MTEMLAGTRKLFPTDFTRFKTSMLKAAEEGELTVTLQLSDLKDFTLTDLQDLLIEFQLETGLDMKGSLFLSDDDGRMHLTLEVNYPEKTKMIPLQ